MQSFRWNRRHRGEKRMLLAAVHCFGDHRLSCFGANFSVNIGFSTKRRATDALDDVMIRNARGLPPSAPTSVSGQIEDVVGQKWLPKRTMTC
jgi:hypothetical protein